MKYFKNSLLFLVILILIIMLYKPLTFKPVPSLSKTPELIGAIHVHSSLSDGRLSPEKIAEEARKSGLDFVILTDHGNPNLKVIEREGEINGISIVAGSEISLFEGSLLAVGIKKPSYKISPVPNEAIDDIKELGGVSIIAHPEKTKNNDKIWDLTKIDGMEIIDLDDEILRKGIPSIFKAFLIYPINSRYALLSLVERPNDQITIWDKMLEKGKISGFYGLNLHGKVWIFPFSYSKIFNLMRIHIPIEGRKPESFEEVKKIIIKSLREGNFFSAIDGAGDSRGFKFYLSGEGNFGKDSYLRLVLPFKSKFEAVLFKNGLKFFSTEKENSIIKINEKGVYRVEVYLKDSPVLKRNVPWILSNPVFLVEKTSKGEEKVWEKIRFFDLKKLVPENDESSEGRITFSGNSIVWNYRLGFSSPSRPHVWCAIALREKFSLEGFKGIGIEATGSPSSRIWLQIRDKEKDEERWWSVSLKVKKDLKEKIFSFDDFRLIKGKKGNLKLKNLESLFLIIDKGSMWEGSKGEIKINSIFAIK